MSVDDGAATSNHHVHATDIVLSDYARAAYVVNLKAASTSIRAWLERYARARSTCTKPLHNMTTDERNRTCCSWATNVGRLTTRCLGPDHASYFLFSFMRDPIAQYESGVRQAWQQNPRLRRYSASQLLEQQVSPGSEWRAARDQHLEAGSWRLSGIAHNGSRVRLAFVGAVETFDEDWSAMLARWPPLANITTLMPSHMNKQLAVGVRRTPNSTSIRACRATMDRTRSCASFLEKTLPGGSHLAMRAICAMCRSRRFAEDFRFFNYSQRCHANNCSRPLACDH